MNQSCLDTRWSYIVFDSSLTHISSRIRLQSAGKSRAGVEGAALVGIAVVYGVADRYVSMGNEDKRLRELSGKIGS